MIRVMIGLLFTMVLCYAACDPLIECPEIRNGNFGPTQSCARYEYAHNGGYLELQLSDEDNSTQILVFQQCGHCDPIDDCVLAQGTNEVITRLPHGVYRLEIHGTGIYMFSVLCSPFLDTQHQESTSE